MVTVQVPIHLPINERQIRFVRNNHNEIWAVIFAWSLLSITLFEG